MATMFVRHTVGDYGNWKHVYDEFAPVRKQKGVIGASVHRDPDDRKVVMVIHRFRDINTARAFANSEELKSAMAEAGVAGAPEIWFADDIEQTPY
jgi:quinol monooxygenase YgiN